MAEGAVSERDLLYLLLRIPGLGRQRIRAIREAYGSFAAAVADWQNLSQKWKVAAAWAKSGEKWNPLAKAAELARQRLAKGVNYLCFLDADYPESLRHIPDPPLALFYRGNLSILQNPLAIGVVGSRKPSAYGQAACAQIVRELVQAGVVIVSGLAYGIDAAAHTAALDAGGKTIGVLGCGIDRIYPAGNRHLYRRMEKDGLLLSEYPPGTPALPGLFPERNRIISGLALGVLVVEAQKRSGSLITADCALEQGKDVFAVPGPIFSGLSAGPHNLVKQGAKLVTSARDVLEEWEHLIPRARAYDGLENTRMEPLSEAEQAVFQLISAEGLHFDVLLERLDADKRPLLHHVLLLLEGKGLIASLPGGFFARRQSS